RPLRLGTSDSWLEARPPIADETVLQYELDYGSASSIRRQFFALTLSPESFREELAGSRTFMLKSEADWLRARGLGQRATFRDLLVFGNHGPIDNQLRYPDECARHKLLDMVGDLALAGCELVGRFRAYRSGHRLNAEMVRTLLAEIKTETDIVELRRQCA
ncbi:MAG: UDP-3-O-acyl-N-acetylglucosamine deacetylase, partial [Planctomycetota bacterium]